MIASRMRGVFCAASALFVASFGGAPPACAGAWPLAQGEGLVIVPATASRAGDRFDSTGKRVDVGSFRKYEVAPYAEYGLTGSLTLVGTFAYLSDETRSVGRKFSEKGFSRVEAGVRISLGMWRGTRFSVQPIVALHGMSEGDDPFASQRGDVDQELDVIMGRNFTLFGMNGFSDTLVGYRRRPGKRPAQVKTDVTLGLKPWSSTMLLLKSQNFTSIARSGSAAGTSASAAKLGLSVVQEIAGPVSFEAGFMQTVTGRNIVREKSLTLGLWYRF